jgi:hypothetical protein
MPPQKVYVADKSNVDVLCPKCEKISTLAMAGIDVRRTFTVRCACGNNFPVLFETRKYYRKPLQVLGLCFSKGDRMAVTIEMLDISRGGCKFKKVEGGKLELREVVTLHFSLGSSQDMVRCSAMVNNIEGNIVGADFLNLDRHSQKIIGFFLMP